MSCNVSTSNLSARMWRAGVFAVVCAVASSVANSQQRGQSAEEEIQALDRRGVALLKDLSKHGEAQSLAQQALVIAERSSGRDSVVVAQRLDNMAFTIRIAMTKPSLCWSAPFPSASWSSVATAPTYARA
jgi:type II secretory pathway component PulJ